MPAPRQAGRRRALLPWAAGPLLLIAGAALFAFSGLYNVAASGRHFGITEAAINLVLARSVAVHSRRIAPPDLSDRGLLRLGAQHFRHACAPCHGSPSGPGNPVVSSMYPAPPDLRSAAREWRTGEIFWIIRHGLKLTGMPTWAGDGRDDEVWALVAFVEALPDMSAEAYEQLAGPPRENAGEALRFTPGDADLAGYCARCHGGDGDPPVHALAPSLDGQKPAYLLRALQEYRLGLRESGFMEPVAAELTDAQIAALARRFSARPPPPGEAADAEAVRRGRRIATEGIAERQVPACASCHHPAAAAHFPRLQGLSAAYIEGQLGLWRAGGRGRSAHGAIMSVIASRLTAEQASDAAAYFAAAGQAHDLARDDAR